MSCDRRERLLAGPGIIPRTAVYVVLAVPHHDAPGAIRPKVAGWSIDSSLERGRHWSGVEQASRHPVEGDLHTREPSDFVHRRSGAVDDDVRQITRAAC